MIKVAEHIKNAFSDSDAAKLTPFIEKELREQGRVELDFSGIRFFTTLFFNNCICKYVLEYGPEHFKQKFHLSGLSEIGQDTFGHSFENACKLTHFSESDRSKMLSIESDFASLSEDA